MVHKVGAFSPHEGRMAPVGIVRSCKQRFQGGHKCAQHRQTFADQHPISRVIRIFVPVDEIASHLVDDTARRSKTAPGCLSSVAVEGSAALSSGPETRVISV